MIEEQELELAKIRSWQDEELRQTRELERVRGVGPFGHASTTKEATMHIEGGHTHPETNA